VKILCDKALYTIRFCLSNEINAPFMAEICPNELWMKLKGMYLSKSLASQTALKKRLYRLRMEDGMDLRVHFGVFNTLVRDVFNTDGKIEEYDQTCLFMASLSKSYDPIMMYLLGKKSDLTMSEVTTVLLDFESLRQRKEHVSGSSSALMTTSDWRRRKRSGRGTCHKCGKPSHFRRDCPERQLNRPLTLEPVAGQL
jgi:gag-polypeptide of LTR copia-type/Zinc knuckle